MTAGLRMSELPFPRLPFGEARRDTDPPAPVPAGSLLPTVEASELSALGAALAAGETSLSGDVLLALADERLADLDAQIGSIMRDLEQTASDTEILSRQVEGLQAIRAAMIASGSTDPTDAESGDLEVEWNGMTMSLDGVLGGIDLYDSVSRTSGDEVRLGTIDALIEAQKTVLDRANSSNELQMIRLQSIMSQRTQVIELVTRMLRALSDMQDSVLRNLGA